MKKYSTEFQGQFLSINKAYNQNRYLRTKLKNEYKQVYKDLIKEMNIDIQIKLYCLEVTYNSRLDPLNLASGIKIFEDCLKEEDLIINDSKHYNKGVNISPDLTLPHNTYIITIKVLDEIPDKTKTK